MRFGILGPLEVIADSGDAVVPSGVKARALLAILLLHANEPVSAERLAVALWGDDAPAGAIKNVQVHVSRLRKALGDGAVIETTPAGYCLRVGPGELDVERFDELVEDGRRALADGDPQRAVALVREALGLWRGPALSDLASESFAVSEIRRLEECRLTANELAIEGDLAAGRHREVSGEIDALVADHPLRERFHAQRMLALYRCGRQAEALEAFREARRLLVDEVGVEPGAELRGLHESILRQDAALDFVRTELPRELDAAGRQAILGRAGELAWLRARWDRAQAGAGELVAVIGPLGIGRTRLAAELASEVHREGATVLYVAGWQRSEDVLAAIRRAADAKRPTLLVADDADANGDAVAALGALDLSRTATLVIANVQDAGSLAVQTALVLEPLGADAARRIALLYAPGHPAADVPIDWLLAASGGVPRRIHEVASEWARREASRRVVAVAPRAAAGRDELRSAEAELVGGVVDLQAARERADSLGEPGETLVCPFKGLASFDVADAKYFFGRERLIAELVARAVGTPLLGVVGPSGSGKSSVVRAGLLPALAGGVLPGSDDWPQVLIRPGEHPLLELRGAMTDLSVDERIVLAVDQFEEVFTACRDEQERTAFIDALVFVAERRSGGVVVLAVRADFYGRCATHRALSGLLGAGHVLVGPMDRDELRRAIELPAARAGLDVEPELVDALIADVDDEPGALPLLSAALLELWQRRDGRRLRHAAYEHTGGVRGAVARLAEQAFGELEPEQQRITRSVLLRLAGEGPGGTVVRRRIPLAELEGHGDEDLARVLAVLADRRLLTVSATTVEVAHEALLREWPRLRGWLEEDTQGRAIHRHLANAARAWNDGERDPGDVYRGARLAAALEWRDDHEHDLNAVERDFLDAGRQIAGRAQRRLRLVLAGVAALLIVAVLGGVIALHQRATARAQARAAQAQRLGIQALTEGDLARSLLLARQGLTLDDSLATRNNLLAALLRAPAAVGVMSGDGNPLGAIAVAPDRRTIATGGDGGNVVFLAAASGRRIGKPYRGRAAIIHALAFSPDGHRLAVAGLDRDSGNAFLDVLDAGTHERVRTLFVDPAQSATEYNGVAFSPDAHVLAASYLAEQVRSHGRFLESRPANAVLRWDLRTGSRLGHSRTIGSLPLQPTRPIGVALVGLVGAGNRLVTSGPGGQGTTIRDVATLRPLRHWPAGGAPAATSPDGRWLAFGAADGSVRLLDLRDGRLRVTSGRHDAGVTAVRFVPGSRKLVTAAADGGLIVWDVRRAAPIETLERQTGGVTALAITSDGRTAYSAGQNGGVIAWDLAGSRRLGRPFHAAPRAAASRFTPGPGTVVATPDGATFAVPDSVGYVHLFDGRTLARKGRIRIGAGAVSALAIEPDGRTLAAALANGNVAFADLRTRRPVGPSLLAHTGLTSRLALSGDDRWLAASGDDPGVDLWDARRRAFANTFTFQGDVVDVSLSPDGTTLVATLNHPGGGELDVVSIARRTTLERVPVAPGRWGRFSADGRLFLYGDDAGRAWVFDAHTWRHGAPLIGHTGPVLTVNLSPDGGTLATTSLDGTTRLWDLASGRAIGTPLPGIAHRWVSAAFVDGGRHLVTVYDTGRGYLWDVSSQSWARRACDIAGRVLTRAEWEDALPERSYAPACVHH
jgi:DNA-binding SARP family transcriptional activator/WD40 repeat protein